MLEICIPNIGLEPYTSDCRGRYIRMKPITNNCPQRLDSIREGSFLINGPRLFNSVPSYIRNISNSTVNQFKNHLDTFLQQLPDLPICDNLKPSYLNHISGKYSNSIIDHVKLTDIS